MYVHSTLTNVHDKYVCRMYYIFCRYIYMYIHNYIMYVCTSTNTCVSMYMTYTCTCIIICIIPSKAWYPLKIGIW